MKKRRIAFAMAWIMAFTSVPVNSIPVYASDEIVEDLIVEDESTETEHIHETDELLSEGEIVIDEITVEDADVTIMPETLQSEMELQETEQQVLETMETELQFLELFSAVDEVMELEVDDESAEYLDVSEGEAVTGLTFDTSKYDYYVLNGVAQIPYDISVTIQYETDSETIQSWGITENATENPVNEYSATNRYGKIVTLRLFEGENQLNITDNLDMGTYMLQASVEGYDDIISQEVRFQYFPDNANNLMPGMDGMTYSVTSVQDSYFTFMPELTGNYWLDFTGSEDIFYEVYELTENSCDLILRNAYYVINNIPAHFRMETGKKYGIRLQSAGADTSGGITLQMEKRIASIAFADEVAEYYAFAATSTLKYTPVLVSYSDDSSEMISFWTEEVVTGEDETYKTVYTANTLSNDIIRMTLEKDGVLCSLPSEYSNNEEVLFGDYTLTVCGFSGEFAESVSKAVKFSVVSENTSNLEQGVASDYEIMSGETKSWMFTAEEEGTYRINIRDEEFSYAQVFVYRIEDNKLVMLEHTGSMDSNRKYSITAKTGDQYLILMQPDCNTYGNISVIKNKNVESVSLNIKDSYHVLELNYSLHHLIAEIVYESAEGEPEDKEQVTDWGRSFNDYENFSDGYLYAETSGQGIILRLHDAEGNQISCPNKGYYSDEKIIHPGDYNLLVYMEGSEKPVNSYSFKVTAPSVEVMKLGEDCHVTVEPNAISIYAFESDATGKGYFHSEADDYYSYYGIVQYDKETGQFTPMPEYDCIDSRIDINSDCIYYIVLYGSNWVSGEGFLETEYVPEITGIELLTPPSRLEYIDSLESFDCTGMTVKVSYVNGTEDVISFNSQSMYDSYDNPLWYDLYTGTEEEGINEENSYYDWKNLTTGDYLLVVRTENSNEIIVPFKAITREEAAEKTVISCEESLTIDNLDGHYICAMFTPEKTGTYKLQSNANLSNLKVYEFDDESYSYQAKNIFSQEINLTANTSYILAMKFKANIESAKLDIRQIKEIDTIETLYYGKPLIAGLDYLTDSLGALITYKDGDKVQLHGNEVDAYGNGFRYEITDQNGNAVEQSTDLNVGNYLIQAIHRTYSAIAGNVTNVSVSGLNLSSLPMITEDVLMTLKPSGSYQLYGFQPSQSGTYNLISDQGIYWQVYVQNTDNGMLERAGKNMTAGEFYVIQIERVSQKCQMTLSAQKEALTLNTFRTFDMTANGTKVFTFKPEEAGKYSIQIRQTGEYAANLSLTVNGWDGQWESHGLNQTAVYGWIEEMDEDNYGECEITVASDCAKASSYEILVKKCDEIKEIQVGVKSTEHYHSDIATCGPMYDINDLLDVELIYTDGSSASVAIDSEDIYGNYVYAEYSECNSKIRNKVTWTVNVYAGDVQESVAVVFDDSTVEMTEIETGITYDIVPDENGWSYFVFENDTKVNYVIDVQDYSNCDVYSVSEWSGWNSHFDASAHRFSGGERWIVAVHTYDECIDIPNQISFYENKEIRSMTLETAAEPFLIRCEEPGAGMTAKVTYKDGTSEIINGSDKVDSWGNKITISYRIVKENTARVYMKCGGYQVYCDVEGKSVDVLKELKVKQYTEVEASSTKNGYTQILAKFIPEEDGTYQFVLDYEGILGSNLMIYDIDTGNTQVLPVEMKAGETYVFCVMLSSEKEKTVGIRPVRVDQDSLCADGHTMMVQSDVAATCTATGMKVSVCSDCGRTVNEMIASYGHQLDTGKITKEATCLQSGIMTYNCLRCGTVVQNAVARKAHNWNSEYTVDLEATCTKEGSQSIHCVDCGTVQDESVTVITKLPHIMSEETTVDVVPTCTGTGSQSIHCTECNSIIEETVTTIEASGHKYADAGIITKQPGCEETGIRTKECSICHEDAEIEIDATGHEFHEEDWNVEKEPDCINMGLKTRSCRNCTKTENVILPAVGHQFDKSQEPITVNADGENQGRVYWPCTEPECDGEEIIRVLLVEEKQQELDAVAENVNNLNSDDSQTDPLSLVDSVTNLNAQDLIDTNSMNVVSTLEESIVAANNNIMDTVVTGSNSEGTAGVSGAAVTVAAELQDSETVDGESYYAEILVEDYVPAVYALRTMALDMEEDAPAKETSHTVYISMNILNSKGETVRPYVSLKAPVTITLPVPEIFADGSRFILSCLAEDDFTISLKYTLSEDGKKVTFNTPVLGYFQFVFSECADGKHVPSEEYTEEDIVTAATCTSAGLRNGVCSVCNAALQVAMEPLGHLYDENSTLIEGSTEATCTASGMAIYECKRDDCSEYISIELPAKGHTWIEDVARSVPATCTVPGEKVYTCFCYAEKTVTVDPLSKTGHSWVDMGTIMDASCYDPGEKEVYCDVCHEENIMSIPRLSHSFDNGRIKRMPTCMEPGMRVFTCNICDEEREEEIPVTDSHTWERKYTIDLEPNCGVEGTESIYCFVCDLKQEGSEVKIPATGEHIWDGGSVEENPTCGEVGKMIFHCLNCETGVKREEIPVTGEHTWDEGIEEKKSTCTEAGVMLFRCSNCETGIKREMIPESGHTFKDDYTVDVQPTCENAGIKSRHCVNCTEITDAVSIPVLAHTWKTVVDQQSTCGKDGSQHLECTICGAMESSTVLGATGLHNFGNYTVVKKPTAVKEGLEVGVCSGCGQTDDKVIAKLPGTIKLSSSKLSIQLNKTVDLKKLISKMTEGDSVKSLASGKKGILSIKGSKITGKKTGSTTVTIKMASGVSAKVTVTVQKKAVPTSSIKVASKKITLQIGKSQELKPVITPISTFDKVSYKTSNKKIVTVNSKGKIIAKKAGTATITIKSGKKSVKVKVTVPKIQPTKITGLKNTYSVKKGKSLTLKPKLYPTKAEAKITYKSSNTKIATVNTKGKVTGKKKGTVTITVKAGKVSFKCKVNVK